MSHFLVPKVVEDIFTAGVSPALSSVCREMRSCHMCCGGGEGRATSNFSVDQDFRIIFSKLSPLATCPGPLLAVLGLWG
jgi:hypothetical protein